MEFSAACRLCPRLADFLEQVRQTQPAYYALPVPSFGDASPHLLIVGLAPGMHGANRTGRPFTGDYAGNLLYSTLHQFGFSSSANPLDEEGRANAGLVLRGCRITNAVRCLPPQNKPEAAEVKRCNAYLAAELEALPQGAAVLALGTVAHGAALRAMGLRVRAYPFRHGARHRLQNGLVLYDSYHCSRYNTQTKRLTATMFREVFGAIAGYLQQPDGANMTAKISGKPPKRER